MPTPLPCLLRCLATALACFSRRAGWAPGSDHAGALSPVPPLMRLSALFAASLVPGPPVAGPPSDGAAPSDPAAGPRGSDPGVEAAAAIPVPSPTSGKLFIGGLSWDTTEATMRSHFEGFGELTDGECGCLCGIEGRLARDRPRIPRPPVDCSGWLLQLC